MKFTPLRITLIYLAFAIIWVTTTDQFVEWWVDDLLLLSQLQTIKGFFFVSLTAILVYVLTKNYEKYITKRKDEEKKKEQVFKNALNTSNVAIWEFNIQNGEFVISENHNKMLGLEPHAAPNMDDILANVHPEDREMVNSTVNSTITKGTDINIEFRVVRDNGDVKWLWSKGNTMFENGEIHKIQGILSDISDVKKLQLELSREQELQKNILEHIPVMITVYKPDISDFKVNKEFEKVTGWTNEEVSQIDLVSKVYPDKNYREEVLEFMSNPDGNWKDIEMTVKSGKKIQSTWTNIRLSDDTQIGIGWNITERKNREKEIEQHRNELQKIYKNIPVMITIQDTEQNIIDANEFFIEKTGYSKEEITTNNIIEKIVSREDISSALNHMNRSDQGWKDFKLISKKGDQIYSSWTNTFVSDNRIIGIGIDLTDRKKIEQKLREKEERLTLTTQSANVGLWEWNPQTGETIFDEMWANLVGYTLEELEPVSIETWRRLIHPEDLIKFKRVVERYFAGKIPIYECEIRMKHKEGHWVWILDRGQIVEKDNEGNPTRLVGTHVDITDRVNYEQENRLLADVFLNSNTGLAVSNHQSNKLERVNDAYNKLFGYEPGEMIGLDIMHLYSDDNYLSPDNIVGELSNKKEITFQAKLQKKDQSTFWGLINLVIVDDNEKKDAYRISTIQDITEIKQREDWIKKLTDNVPGAIYNYRLHDDGTDELTYMSSGCKEIWGVDHTDALDDSSLLWERVHPDDLESMRKSILESAESLEKWDYSWRIVHENGDIIWVNGFGQPEKLDDGSILWHSFIQDITLRKQQEEELKRSRDRLLQAQEIAKLGYWTFYPENETIWWSDVVYDIYDQDKQVSDINLNRYLKLTHPEDRSLVQNALYRGLNENSFSFTHRILKSDNRIGHVQVRGEKLYDVIHEQSVLNGTVLDITDLKTFEKQLAEQQKRFEIAANITSDVIYEWNPKTAELWWGEGIESVLGFEEKQYKDIIDFWQNQIHPDDKERVVKSMNNAENSDTVVWWDEYRFIAADNSIRDIEDRAMIIRDEQGNADRIIGAMVDVTEKKKVEQQLRASEEQYRLLFQQSPIPMWIYDPNTLKIVTANDAAVEKYGYTKNEFLNLKVYKLHPKDEMDRAKNEISKNLNYSKTNFDVWDQITKDGKKLNVEISGSEIFYNGKKHRLITANDVTEKRQAQEKLKASEEQYRLLFEQNPIPMFIYDPETFKFTAANNAAIDKYKYSLDEFLEMSIFDIRPQKDIETVKEQSIKNRAVKNTTFDESIHITKHGKKLTAEVSASHISYQGRNQRLVIANDITEQRLAEERAISAVVEGEDRERRRVAQELHDGLGQYLSAANMNLRSVYEDMPANNEHFSKTFKTGLELLNIAISETRNISQNLLPKAIQDYGLELATESLINKLKNSNDIKFYFYQNLSDIVIPEKIQINLYRILQESLNNAIRHGKPANIDVQLVYSADELLLVIEDNGVGFNVNSTMNEGLGLRSIKTRVGAMSGNLDIVSSKGKGTIVSVIVPL